jgi:DnaJ-class molecular chaperone
MADRIIIISEDVRHERRVCPKCDGNKRCTNCGGDGKKVNPAGLLLTLGLSEMFGGSNTCPTCQGTGNCSRCDGTGFI